MAASAISDLSTFSWTHLHINPAFKHIYLFCPHHYSLKPITSSTRTWYHSREEVLMRKTRIQRTELHKVHPIFMHHQEQSQTRKRSRVLTRGERGTFSVVIIRFIADRCRVARSLAVWRLGSNSTRGIERVEVLGHTKADLSSDSLAISA